MRHAFLNPAILALTLPIGAGSMADDPAGPNAQSSAATPAATTTTGSGSGREAASTGRLHFKPLGLSSFRPHATGRIPVVLVHGLWAGPRLWEPMVEARRPTRTSAGDSSS